MKNAAVEYLPSDHPSTEEINRNRVLDACVESVGEFGLQSLQMNHVIERSGLSRRTVYKYFSNKADIVNAAYLREAFELFVSLQREVSACSSVEDIFVLSFMRVYKDLPKNPLMKELIHHNRELLENLHIEESILETIPGLELTDTFKNYPEVLNNIEPLMEYWAQVTLSFLLLDSGKNKTLKEVEAYVIKRFVPGLCLDEFK